MKIPLQCWLMTSSADHLKFDFLLCLGIYAKTFSFFVCLYLNSLRKNNLHLLCWNVTSSLETTDFLQSEKRNRSTMFHWKMLKGKIIEKNNLQKTNNENKYVSNIWMDTGVNERSTARIIMNNTCVCLWK